MAFGSSVDTLIDIYSNCISLLKAFNRRDESGARQEDKRQAQLRKSLKEDRARVRRAYSSAVSEAGSRFEKGDDRARSSLSRVLKKLKAAITNILRSSSKHQQPALDYESLLHLSNASRTEAIRTFDQLSRRLGSTPSRTSVASSSSSSKRRSKKSSSSSAAGSKSSTSREKDMPSRKPTSPRPEDKEVRTSRSKHESRNKKPKSPSPPPTPQPKHKQTIQHATPVNRSRTPTERSRTQGTVPNRISLASIATDSTKLGEIPERRWTSRRRATDSLSSDDSVCYNVTPVFPLKPYEPPVKERSFLGLFRRRT